MAARLRRELDIDVGLVHGKYAEYTILVDDKTVIDGGAMTALGVVPSGKKVVAAVRAAPAE